jgi:putative transposase
MYPNKQQTATLEMTLETCRNLWNRALEDRQVNWELNGVNISYESQCAILTIEKSHCDELYSVHAHVLQNVLKRLRNAFDNFFRRTKNHEKEKGYPRFKSKNRYNSFTYPDTGFKLNGSRLTLSKIPGTIRTFVHRPVEGKLKTCTIKRHGTGNWFVIFMVEQEDPVKLEPRTALGVDLGISHAVTTSEGQTFDYPKYYVQAEKKNRAAEKSLHRKKLGSKNRRKAKVKLAVIGKRVTNLRDEFLHQVSRKLVDSVDLVVFEDLQISNMLKNHCLAKAISDVSWGKLIRFTQSKAERAGKCVVLVDPRYTSQMCSCCGELVPKDLSVRTHDCPHCGLKLDRDHNAALNILTLGLRGGAYGDLTSGVGKRSRKRRVKEVGSPV